MLYTRNKYNVVCQLYLNYKKRKKRKAVGKITARELSATVHTGLEDIEVLTSHSRGTSLYMLVFRCKKSHALVRAVN